jgi:hypothetical protein
MAEDRRLGLGAAGEGGAGRVQQLDLDRRPQVLGERVVETVPDAACGGRDAGVGQASGEPDGGVLGEPLSE